MTCRELVAWTFVLVLSVAAVASASCNGGGGDASAQGIYVFDLSSGELRNVSDDAAYDVSWTADGSSIWYATDFLPSGDGEIASVEVASSGSERVVDLDGGGFASLAAASDAGAWIGRDLTVETYTDGERASVGPGIGVDVSPDGASVLYLTPPCASAQSLVVSAVDGSTIRDRIDRAFNAAWQADGRISYNLPEPDPAQGSSLRIYDGASGASLPARDVLGVEPGGAYFLSPDGSFVLYGGDVNRIFLRDIGAAFDVDLGRGRASLVTWSPDSTYVAYAAFDLLHIAGRDGVDRYTLDLTQLSDVAAQPLAIAWSPDGSKVALSSAALPEGSACPSSSPEAGG
jgi:WD40 repeat protein